MKKYQPGRYTRIILQYAALALFPSAAWSQSVYFAGGQQVYIGNQVSVPVELVNAGAVTIGGGALQFSGNDYRSLSGASYSGAGYVVFNTPAAGTQSLYAGDIFFRNLRINNANNVVLAGADDAGVTDTLDFASGRLQLGGLNLGMGGNGIFKGYAADRYVITNGTGTVGYNTAAAGKSLFFPVGATGGTDYSPAFVKNGATQQTVYMRVQRVPGAGQTPDTVKGIRRVWNLWTSGGGGLDSLALYHNDSLNGSQYTSNQASVNRYISPSWQTGPCPFSVETLSGGLRVLAAHSSLLGNTATAATGNAYYSKSSDVILPTVSLGANPSTCAGDTADLPYSAATGNPSQYSIVWDAAALAAGFSNITGAALQSGNIRIPAPGGAPGGTYTGTLTVSNGLCSSNAYTFSITVHPQPQPVVTWDGLTLRTDSTYTAYQWSLAGQPILAANSFTYVPILSGNYAVTVTDSNGCSNTSSAVLARVGVRETAAIPPVHIYPNPSRGKVYVAAPVPVHILLSSMDGREILRLQHATEADITGLPDGLYLMRVTDTEGQLLKMEKLMKN